MSLSGELVEIVIEGDEVFEDRLDDRVYRIQPGVKTVIPVEGANLWFGYPTILSDNPQIRMREEQRIKARRGGTMPKITHIARYESASVQVEKKEEVKSRPKEDHEEEEFPELKELKRRR